jgi:predicted NAD/FAD-binding protein
MLKILFDRKKKNCSEKKNCNNNQYNTCWLDAFLRRKAYHAAFKNKGIVLSIGDGIARV